MLLINGFFALAYLALGAGALRGTEDNGDRRSVSPGVHVQRRRVHDHRHRDRCTRSAPTANWLANLESFVGPITLVIAFGLLIARLTRPRMRIGFSESAIIAPYEGGRALMFRIVNLQPGELSDVQARVNLARFEDFGGSRERNFHALALERNSVEFFTLHWTVVHPITADSPLAGVTPESLADSQAEFLIFVNALEETFSTRVSHAGLVPVGRGALGREVREHLRERPRWCDRDRRRAAEPHRAARGRRDAHARTARARRRAFALGGVPSAGSHSLEVELLLERAKHLVGDRVLVAQPNEHPSLGVDHREAQPAAPLVAAALLLVRAQPLAQLGAQRFHVARIDPRLVRQILERLGAAPRRLASREPLLDVARFLRLELQRADDRRRARAPARAASARSRTS